MSTGNRKWVTEGTSVIGTAPGKPDIIYAPVDRPDTPATVDELRETAEKLTAALNADGTPRLTANQQRVIDAVREHQSIERWPAPMRKVCEATGLTRPTVSLIFDQLVEMGLGSRPPKNMLPDIRLPRPFILTEQRTK